MAIENTTTTATPTPMQTPSQSVRVKILNLTENECLSYPLVLVEGVVSHAPQQQQNEEQQDGTETTTTAIHCIHASLRNLTNDTTSAGHDAPARVWPVFPSNGHFKAFVMLPRPGSHCIQLCVDGNVVHELTIRYTRPETTHFARFHYEKQRDDPRGFDAPEGVDNSDAAALARVQFGALLTQTCIAELFHKQGMPRYTFALEFDDSLTCEMPRVNLLTTSANEHKPRPPSSTISRGLARQNRIAMNQGISLVHFVHIGSNHFDPALGRVPNHCAYSLGHTYVFSSVTLHTWPRGLDELTKRLLDATEIDTSVLIDDSAWRMSHWANFSTGLGVFISFFLGSCAPGVSDEGILGRGFDNVNRLLSVVEPVYACPNPEAVYRTGATSSGTDNTIELDYDLLHYVGDDVAGAYVVPEALAVMTQDSPFVTTPCSGEDTTAAGAA